MEAPPCLRLAERKGVLCGRVERVFVYTRYRGKKTFACGREWNGGDRTISKSAFLNDTEEEEEKGAQKRGEGGARRTQEPRYTMGSVLDVLSRPPHSQALDRHALFRHLALLGFAQCKSRLVIWACPGQA